MDQRHDQSIAAEEKALVGLLREQVLVGGGQLAGQNQRCLGRFERVAGQRMRGTREMALEIEPERQGGRIEFFGKLEALRFGKRDAIDGRQRVADRAGGFDRVALEHFVQPWLDARGPRLRRMRGTRFQTWQAEREGHDVGIFLSCPDCSRWRRDFPNRRGRRRLSRLIEERDHRSHLIFAHEHRGMADVLEFDHLRPRSSLLHCGRRRRGEQVRVRAAQQQRRA